jgi:hypothetical protein
MRSRPALEVYLTPQNPVPGDRLRVKVHLDVHSETPCDAIDVVLVGRESRYKRTSQAGKTAVRKYHRREIFQLGKRFDGGVLSPGTWDRELFIDIPADAPPSYQSGLASIGYELEVRVHIPWWPDRHEKYEVKLRPRAWDPGPPRACVFTSLVGENRGEEPVLELSLEDDRLPLGGKIAGAVALTGLGNRKIRRIEVALSAMETALVASTAGPTETDRRTWVVYEGTPAEGASIPFRIRLPDDAPATFHSPYIRVDQALEATAVVAFGRDVAIRAPVTVLATAARDRPLARSADLPLVGRQRHVAVWRAAVDQVRVPGVEVVAFAPEEATATLEVRGIRVVVSEEHREGLGPCLVAACDWPALGLGLRLGERSWTDVGGKLDEVDRAFQKRFLVRAREGAQAAALLGHEVRQALELFDEAGMDDSGAVVLRKGGVYQVAGLERFLALTANLATRLSRAIALLPPPAALCGNLGAWRAFAEGRGATLCVGDMSLDGWTVRGVPLTLGHRWEEARPVESLLSAPRPERGEPGAWTAELGKATQRSVFVEERRVGITLPTVTDPEVAASMAERFAIAMGKLLGAGALGPYR